MAAVSCKSRAAGGAGLSSLHCKIYRVAFSIRSRSFSATKKRPWELPRPSFPRPSSPDVCTLPLGNSAALFLTFVVASPVSLCVAAGTSRVIFPGQYRGCLPGLLLEAGRTWHRFLRAAPWFQASASAVLRWSPVFTQLCHMRFCFGVVACKSRGRGAEWGRGQIAFSALPYLRCMSARHMASQTASHFLRSSWRPLLDQGRGDQGGL